jgi:hypothetical protein
MLVQVVLVVAAVALINWVLAQPHLPEAMAAYMD